jgi:hypothetical protein
MATGKDSKGKWKAETGEPELLETTDAEAMDEEQPMKADELPSFSKMDEEDLNDADAEPREIVAESFDGEEYLGTSVQFAEEMLW